MKSSTQIVTALVSMVLIITYYVPMWTIDLDAPQYPEGLGLEIWLGEIRGDLNTINNLNHYIGMKTINPETMTEFAVMPYLIGCVIGLGFLVSLFRSKKFYAAWAVSFILVGIIGLFDFYMWEYDYGHDLDPTAAIQVPGMSYQPPLIGSKELLNFTAYSYPASGGIIIIASMISILAMLLLEFRKSPKESGRIARHRLLIVNNVKKTAAIFSLCLLVSCEVKPQPINYGADQCSLCKMSISDERYGSEIVTKKGKTFKFDSIECMINYLLEENEKDENIHSILITDYTNPGSLTDAKTAHYLISEDMPSPMGAYLSGYSDENTAKEFQKKYHGKLFNWEEILQKFRN